MKSILLIGLGRFGMYLAQALTEQGNEVMAVDRDEERVNDALKFVTNAVIGDSTSQRFIKSLGVSNFDMCIVTIADNFQASLETTSLLKDEGASFVLSRASHESHAKFLLRNGADDVIFIEKQMADWAAVKYSDDRIFDYMQLSNEYAVYETVMPRTWVGKTVAQLDVRKKYNVNILGTKRNGVLTPSDVNHIFSSEERLMIMGDAKDVQRLLKK